MNVDAGVFADEATPDVEVSSWRDGVEAYRASVALAGSEIDDAMIRGGSLGKIEGPAHDERRKTMNSLLTRGGHQRFRDATLFPTVARNLQRILDHPAADGVVRADLMGFAMTCNLQLAAAIAGLRAAATDPGAQALFEIDAILYRVAEEEGSRRYTGGSSEEAIASAALAKRRLRDEFFVPELAARRDMLARVESGAMTRDELPNDLMTLIAARADPRWADDDVALKDVMLVVRGASHTTSDATCRVIDHLGGWFAAHPEDRALRTDPAFLLAAASESLRLGTLRMSGAAGPARPASQLRRVTAGVTLSSGVRLEAGQIVAIRGAARDGDAFGPDADEFNPHRKVPRGVYPYGLAFGAGPHMCFGLPMVLGAEGIDGSLVHMLRTLHEAGVRKDGATPARRRRFGAAGFRYDTYPVIFERT